jgi:hypothetical protein
VFHAGILPNIMVHVTIMFDRLTISTECRRQDMWVIRPRS